MSLEQIKKLLDEGRAILAKKDAEKAKQESDIKEFLDAEWQRSADTAKKIFGSLALCFKVEPESPCEGWNPQTDQFHNKPEFFVRPFGNGKIEVRLKGERDFMVEARPETTWSVQDNRVNCRYYVESAWNCDFDGECLRPVLYESTGSAAEALALCEKSATHYVEAAQRLAQGLAERKNRVPGFRVKTPGDVLLDSLEAWHDSRRIMEMGRPALPRPGQP